MEKEQLKADLMARFMASATDEFTVQQLVDELQMTKAGQFKFVVKALADLEHEHKITLNQNGAFTLAEDKTKPKFEGVFHANDRGFGFVTIDPEEQDFFINPTQTKSALNGDTVEVEMVTPGDPEKGIRPEGKVTAIKEHALTQVVGAFEVNDEEQLPKGILGTMHIKDKKLSMYRFMVEDTGLHPVPGEVILADISAYPDPHLPGIIKVVAIKTIGNVNDPGMDILEIVYQHNIPTAFPEDVLEQIKDIPDEVTPAEKEGRRDLTDQKLVTIDSIESKDLDDAVNVWQLPNGNYHLGVHIADVSHYVTPGTPLDREAFERGTSVYLTDRVIPMLPPKLSNGICSLNPHVERLAMTCEMEITPQGEVVAHEIFPSVIKSTERMTYVAINKILESDDAKLKERYADLVPMFQDMKALHKILLKMRKKRGAIEFEDTEAKIIVDEQGHPVDIQLRERGMSERMVESFMLAANETVAKHFNDLHVPFLYRIHEKPKDEKIKSFYEVLASFGIEVHGKIADLEPKVLQQILKKVAGKPEEPMISTLMLRSMQQAKYSDQPLGHFGLAAVDYTHFTSPIRRYPDLMVHRMARYYRENGIGKDAQAEFINKLPEIATHSSEMERRAIDAERDTDATKKAEYMSGRVGEVFEAIVSSVTKFGMFVQLPNTVEGLIHISELGDDYYIFLEKQMALVGRRYKRTFRIGQPIKVKLIAVNVEQKEINFKLVNAKEMPTSDLLERFKDEIPERDRERMEGNKHFHKRKFDDKKGKNFKGGFKKKYDRHEKREHRGNNKNRHHRNFKKRKY